MSVNHFNYTSRRRIPREHVQVVLLGDLPDATVSAQFTLASHGFPETARLVLEAQSGWTVQRFDFGTVGAVVAPKSPQMREFDTLAGVLFRLKVVATGDREGMLLGVADGLRPSTSLEDGGQRSFVVVRPADLGDVIWRLEFEEEQAVLLINNRLGDHHDFLRRREVVALVFPEVLRQLLIQAAENPSDEGDTAHWTAQALVLGARLATRPAPTADGEEALQEWAVEAVKAFARRHRLLDNVGSWIEEEQ
jgi:hypothetical protein